ncbi:TPA: hypothetical protein ENS27_02180 [bacterium]|nr:hypothetical protein [bacterium]
MPKFMEFNIEPEMILGYEGGTDWLKLFDDKKNLRLKIEARRGIYLFSVDPPEINIEIYSRLNDHIPDVYSQITHIGGMKSSKAQSTRYDIFERAVKDYHGVRNRNVNSPSKYSPQRLEKSRIMQEFGENFYVKIYYTDSDEAEMYLLSKYIEKFGCKPPWDL